MATYGEVKTEFTSLLNRRDITAAQTTTFVQNALRRAQRNLRVPAMEQAVEVEIGDDYAGLPLPSDYLQLIRLVNSDGEELERVDLTTANARAETTGVPKVFCRQGSKWVLGPTPLEDDTVRIDYFGQFEDLEEDADENWLTEIAPDLLVYGALSFAGKHFNDRRRQEWEQMYRDIFLELQDQGDRDELINAVVMPAYALPIDETDY